MFETDRHSRAFHVTIVVFFATVIFLPWFDLVRPADASGPLEAELRQPAPPPGAIERVGDLSSYPGGFEEHFNDTFGFRDWFLRGHSMVKLFAFGVSPTPSVLVGKDGWLFYTGDRTIEDHRGLLPFSEDDLQGWVQMLEARRDWLAARGSDYVLVIVPNKEEIYPELLPDHLAPLGPTRLDQLLEYVREHSTVDVFDMRPAMLAAKEDTGGDTQPYLKLGTHWNGAGSYIAYKALIEHLRQRHPELEEPLPREAFRRREIEGNADSWGRKMYVDDLLTQDVVAYMPEPGAVRMITDTGFNDMSEHVLTCATAPKVRAMLFHDSFGPYNYMLLASSFARLACHWRSDFPTEIIEREAPDIVIEQFVQRWLVNKNPRREKRAYVTEKVLDEETFQAFQRQLMRLDLPGDHERLRTVGSCRTTPLPENGQAEVSGVKVEFDDKMALLRLPDTRSGRGNAALLLDFTAPEAGRMRIYFGREGAEVPLRKDGYRAEFEEGRNRILVRLSDPETTGHLFLRPINGPDAIVLHGVSMRAPKMQR